MKYNTYNLLCKWVSNKANETEYYNFTHGHMHIAVLEIKMHFRYANHNYYS
jgi:hypothetical protein